MYASKNKYHDQPDAWNDYKYLDITTDASDAFLENLFRIRLRLKEGSTLQICYKIKWRSWQDVYFSHAQTIHLICFSFIFRFVKTVGLHKYFLNYLSRVLSSTIITLILTADTE